MVDEKTWIERAVAGDVAAFEKLVHAYQDRLFHAIHAVAGKFQDAEDICQDAFVSAFRHLGKFRGESNFYTWLFRIAINTLHSCNRKQRPMDGLTEDMFDTGSTFQPARDNVDARLIAADRATIVRAALRSLPEDYRQVLVLRDVDDQNYDTIASLLKVPVGTVRSRLHRARQMLYERLRMDLPEGGLD